MDLEDFMLNQIIQTEKVKNHMTSLICGYKTESNKMKQTNKLIDTMDSMVVTRGKRSARGIRDKGGQIHGERR